MTPDEEKAGDQPAITNQKSKNDLMTKLIPKTSIASIKESTRSATAAMSTTAEVSFRDGKRAIVEKSARSLKAVEETSVRGLKAMEETSSKGLKLAEEAVARAAAGLDALNSEIANHYLDGLKYGMAGSDGTCWSNYVLYYQNHHEILGMFFADNRNPYSKYKRIVITLAKICLSFFLLAGLSSSGKVNDIVQVIVTVAVMAPFGMLVDSLARCEVCHRRNVCVNTSRKLGNLFLTLIMITNIGLAVFGIALLVMHKIGIAKFAYKFFISVVLDALQPLYMGVWNWLLHSWEGVLCIPQFHCFGGTIFPPRFVPLLGLAPIKFLLNLYNLGEATYDEDKVTFIEKYPNRVAIDNISQELVVICSENPDYEAPASETSPVAAEMKTEIDETASTSENPMLQGGPGDDVV